MVKKPLTTKQKLGKINWKELLGNPLRVLLYPLLAYLITLPPEQLFGWLESTEQRTLAVLLLSGLFSLLYNGNKAIKNV